MGRRRDDGAIHGNPALSEEARIEALVTLFRRKLEAHGRIDRAKKIQFRWYERNDDADLDVTT